jgi:hypothetical protein
VFARWRAAPRLDQGFGMMARLWARQIRGRGRVGAPSVPHLDEARSGTTCEEMDMDASPFLAVQVGMIIQQRFCLYGWMQ